jgi:hypothetical protein
MIALCYKCPEIQDNTLPDLRIVAPVVAGSIPVIHPSQNSGFTAENKPDRFDRPDAGPCLTSRQRNVMYRASRCRNGAQMEAS